jgi:hypothetical protein
LVKQVGVRFNVLAEGIFDPNMLIGIVLDTEAVSDQQGSIGKFAIAEIDLRIGVEMRLVPSLHFEVGVLIFALFLGLIVVLPSCVCVETVLNSLFVFDLLVLSPLGAVELNKVLSVGNDVHFGFFYLFGGMLELLAASLVFVFKYFELLDDLSEIDEGKPLPL